MHTLTHTLIFTVYRHDRGCRGFTLFSDRRRAYSHRVCVCTHTHTRARAHTRTWLTACVRALVSVCVFVYTCVRVWCERWLLCVRLCVRSNPTRRKPQMQSIAAMLHVCHRQGEHRGVEELEYTRARTHTKHTHTHTSYVIASTCRPALRARARTYKCTFMHARMTIGTLADTRTHTHMFTHAHTYAHVDTCTRTCTLKLAHARTHTHTHLYKHTHMHTHTLKYTHAHTHRGGAGSELRVFVFVRVCVGACMRVCARACVCAHDYRGR